MRALRPRQWVKNVLVFIAPAAAAAVNHWDIAGEAALAFVCFCLAASATYLINDAIDLEADRLHPVKSLRPIASGLVSLPLALSLALVLAGGSLALGFSATHWQLGIV
ncbi:MAG: UbiA family prenyltransferase, partial [Actinomycetota bacterium]